MTNSPFNFYHPGAPNLPPITPDDEKVSMIEESVSKKSRSQSEIYVG